MTITPIKAEQHKPDGLNIFVEMHRDIEALKQTVVSLSTENQELRERLAMHEERLNNLSLPPTTVNELNLRALRTLGNVLIAVTEPQQQQAQPQAEVQPTEAAVEEVIDTTDPNFTKHFQGFQNTPVAEETPTQDLTA